MRHASLWDRLTANIRIEGDCWTWTGPVRRHGGGHRPAVSLRTPGAGAAAHPKQYNAARVMCELIHGPAPEGHEASHLCGGDNWLCVSPDHLIWETHKENCARRSADRMREAFEPDLDARGVTSIECPF